MYSHANIPQELLNESLHYTVLTLEETSKEMKRLIIEGAEENERRENMGMIVSAEEYRQAAIVTSQLVQLNNTLIGLNFIWN